MSDSVYNSVSGRYTPKIFEKYPNKSALEIQIRMNHGQNFYNLLI
jgi:hypothetical protein